MSQEQLAAASGLDRSFISLVERGIQSPNIIVLLKVAEVLGVSAADLIAKTEIDHEHQRSLSDTAID